MTALTNEGRFESKATKKRTAKDECKLPAPYISFPSVCNGEIR